MMSESAKIPTALRVVAYIHLVMGILCVIQFIVQLFHSAITLSLGILYFPIAYGLFNLRNGWRVCAMVFLWFGLILLPIIFVVGLFGTNVARIPGWVVSVETIPFFLIFLWQYRVLVRPDVRRLFLEPRPGSG